MEELLPVEVAWLMPTTDALDQLKVTPAVALVAV